MVIIIDEKTMKKIFSTIMLLFAISTSLLAQKDVTKFLGIPVDGSKTKMIQKLKEKGFRYNNRYDCLEGEFNDTNVSLHVITNRNNKVWRIMVADISASNEQDIKIRFNHLCRQFSNNKKYVSASPTDYMLADDEDISYEMSVHNKRYEASYYQLPDYKDSVIVAQEMRSVLLQKYTKEQISNPTEKERTDMLFMYTSYMVEKHFNKPVWFIIMELYGKYRIIMYYDNEYNKSNGKDL